MTDDHWVFTVPLDLPLALVPFTLSFLSCGEMYGKSCHSDSPIFSTSPCLMLIWKLSYTIMLLLQ